jgi:hypothetical protein
MGDYYVKCAICSDFVITREAYDDYFVSSRLERSKTQLLRHYLHKKQQAHRGEQLVKIDRSWIKRVMQHESFPSVSEQADNLILWLGENESESPPLVFNNHGHIIGSDTAEKFQRIIEGLQSKDLIRSLNPSRLNFAGLEKYEQLMKGTSLGHNAFMAMEFGDAKLMCVFENCFVPAVEATGFVLRKLDDEPEAGLIDNILRQKIRQARFIIADLTHGNKGAYWEAGYGEGLGKPVIYTCEKQVFENVKTKPHFDANHHQTILWNSESLNKAAEQLKATIRCTIPEAREEDIK